MSDVLGSMVSLALGGLMLTLATNALVAWDLAATCPGPTSFCNGQYWTLVEDQLKTWVFIAMLLVVLVLGSPFAILRRGRGI